MDTVYIMESGVYIRREGASLNVCKDHQIIDRIPAEGLKHLTLIGWVTLSGSVLDFLIQNRVETVFMTPTGRFRARLTLDEHRHVALRKAQYLRLDKPETALDAAKSIVYGKVMNMYRFLMAKARTNPVDALKISAARLKSLIVHVQNANDLTQLRSMEGAATRIYFDAFPMLIHNDRFHFSGRNRRPPRDPINALLSFVYTLLTNEVLSAVKTCGLDPYLGSLHEISYGRPSLACDLVEEFRTFLGERLVLTLINKKVITPDDFVFRKAAEHYADENDMKANRPVEMKPAVSKTFIAAYEEMMRRNVMYPYLDKQVTHRWLIHHQVRRFGNFLEQKEPHYQPFIWER